VSIQEATLFRELQHRLADRGTTLELTEQARRLIAEHGYDPVYGARPLRRYLAHELETRIGRALLSGDLREGAVIRVDVRNGELIVRFVEEHAAAS
jgi:ATP-dependent Clp protease ATP-binding subunit ClpB